MTGCKRVVYNRFYPLYTMRDTAGSACYVSKTMRALGRSPQPHTFPYSISDIRGVPARRHNISTQASTEKPTRPSVIPMQRSGKCSSSLGVNSGASVKQCAWICATRVAQCPDPARRKWHGMQGMRPGYCCTSLQSSPTSPHTTQRRCTMAAGGCDARFESTW